VPGTRKFLSLRLDERVDIRAIGIEVARDAHGAIAEMFDDR